MSTRGPGKGKARMSILLLVNDVRLMSHTIG